VRKKNAKEKGKIVARGNANKMHRGGCLVKVKFIVAGDRERKSWVSFLNHHLKKSFRSKRIHYIFGFVLEIKKCNDVMKMDGL
jgi:hypothetical protein